MTKPVNLAALLGQDIPCPCNRGYMLRTVEDRERGYCVLCHMLSPGFKLIPKPPAKIWGGQLHDPLTHMTFRSEAETYDEGICDDD